MSSISSADRARQTDEAREVRSEYEQREAENAKRNRNERKRLEEQHRVELERLKQDYDNQLSAMRNKNRDSLSDRDQAYSDQIEKMRRLYVEQLQRKSEENESARNEIRRTFQTDSEKKSQVHAQQEQSLKQNFDQSLQARDTQFQDFANKAAEDVKTTVEDRRQKINAQKEKEVSAIANDRDRKVSQMSLQSNQMKKQSQADLREQQRRYEQELDRKDSHWRSVVDTQDKMNNTLLDNKNQVMTAARNKMQDDYREAADRNAENMEKARERLTTEVNNRTDSTIRQMASELREVQNDRIVEAITNRRLRDLERKSLVEANQQRFEALDRERTQIYDTVNERARGLMQENRQQTEKVLQDTNRENKMKQNIITMQAREDRGRLESEMQSRLEQSDVEKDKRIRRVMNQTGQAQKTQEQYHQKNLDQIKTAYYDNLQSQREAQFDLLNKVKIQSEQKLHDIEMKNAKRVDDLVTTYEEKIEKIKEEGKNDKERLISAYEGRLSQRDKAHQAEQETLQIKYEAKLAAADEQRQKEMERIERRTQEQLTSMNNRMKAYNKKV